MELGQKTAWCESLWALLHYVEWDRFVTLNGAQAEWGLRYRIYDTSSFLWSVLALNIFALRRVLNVFCVWIVHSLLPIAGIGFL